jgi:hypothetical protein
VGQARYLVDTSVLARLAHPPVRSAVGPLAVAGRIAVCAPVVFELGFAARNGEQHEALLERITAYPLVAVTDADHRRAIEVQGLLARSGRHRALSLVDGLVAAAAESRGLVVLHYDADFELVAGVTHQAHEWVVERGTAD